MASKTEQRWAMEPVEISHSKWVSAIFNARRSNETEECRPAMSGQVCWGIRIRNLVYGSKDPDQYQNVTKCHGFGTLFHMRLAAGHSGTMYCLIVEEILLNCGWDLDECGWNLAEGEWDLTECGWDLSDCGLDLAEWLESMTANAEVATVLGSIPASSDT